MAAAASNVGASPPEAAGSPEAPLQYSLLLQYLVGDKRQPRLLEPGSLGGIPSPAKSEEQKMMERAMESCAFKAALACVGGEARSGGPRAAGLPEGVGSDKPLEDLRMDSVRLCAGRGWPHLQMSLSSIGNEGHLRNEHSRARL
jgi:import inner membrane translocase subunit TIM22